MKVRIVGLMMVRNEADILRVNVLHHLSQGVDRFLVVDNGSSDDTARILEELSREAPLEWESYDGPYQQSRITTALAQEAYLQGADWVIAIDADEFWCAPEGNLRDVLSETSADVLRADVVNFVQQSDQLERSPEALLHMTRRTGEPLGPIERIRELAESKQASYVELVYPPKCVSRASPAIEIGLGNHSVQWHTGQQQDTTRIVCLHAPLRARSVLGTLADQGRRAEESGNRLIWNWLRWQRLATEGTLEAEWKANSHADGCLDVYGEKRPLVEDLRLRNAVAPWLNGGVPENSRTKHAISSRPGRNLKSRLRLREQAAGFLSDTLRLMDETEGWFTRDEGRLLIMGTVLAFCERPAHSIVELGSYLGRSTVVLGRVVEDISKGTTVHAIDPHEGDLTEPGDVAASEEPTYERFLENIRRAALEHVVEPIRRRSFNVQWNQPISLLLVDALHDYENVSRDFRHFEEWLLPGSVVAFHDYGETYPGVQRFVDEILQSGRYEIVARIDILILLKKVGDPHAPQRKVMTNTNEEATSERLERQTKGISILQEVLRSELAARVEQVGERDKIILRQQAELFEKVGERDEIIRNLHAELQAKVAERDKIIEDLHDQLQAKVSERDEIIRELQSRLTGGDPKTS